MQTGTVPRLCFCQRPWRLKIDFGKKYRETCCVTHHQANTPTPKPRLKFNTMILSYPMSIVFPQTWNLLVLAPCFTFLRIRSGDQDDHVSRTHRVALDWLFDRINLDPKISNQHVDTKKPTRRHTDKGQIHMWRVEPSSPFGQYQHFPALPAALKECRKGYRKETGEDIIVAKSIPTLNLVSKTKASSSTQTARGYSKHLVKAWVL